MRKILTALMLNIALATNCFGYTAPYHGAQRLAAVVSALAGGVASSRWLQDMDLHCSREDKGKLIIADWLLFTILGPSLYCNIQKPLERTTKGLVFSSLAAIFGGLVTSVIVADTESGENVFVGLSATVAGSLVWNFFRNRSQSDLEVAHEWLEEVEKDGFTKDLKSHGDDTTEIYKIVIKRSISSAYPLVSAFNHINTLSDKLEKAINVFDALRSDESKMLQETSEQHYLRARALTELFHNAMLVIKNHPDFSLQFQMYQSERTVQEQQRMTNEMWWNDLWPKFVYHLN